MIHIFNQIIGCATHPPGLRAQFLVHLPSGLWITNVSNAFYRQL